MTKKEHIMRKAKVKTKKNKMKGFAVSKG